MHSPFGNLRLVKLSLNRFLSPLIHELIESPPDTFSLIDCPFYTFISCKYKTDFKKVKGGTNPRNYSIEDLFKWRDKTNNYPEDILEANTELIRDFKNPLKQIGKV